jgi:hypothetical protein
MRKILFIVSFLALIVGCQNNTPQVVSNQPIEDKTAVILGTYNWDVETNTLGSNPKSDFWYRRSDAKHGSLVVSNGAMIEMVSKPYEKIDKEFITSMPLLRDGSIDSSNLKVGTVAVFQTAEGHYGKLKIIGFKALHDFNFKEAQKYLDKEWREFVLRKPDTKKYHLVVKYKLYK